MTKKDKATSDALKGLSSNTVYESEIQQYLDDKKLIHETDPAVKTASETHIIVLRARRDYLSEQADQVDADLHTLSAAIIQDLRIEIHEIKIQGLDADIERAARELEELREGHAEPELFPGTRKAVAALHICHGTTGHPCVICGAPR